MSLDKASATMPDSSKAASKPVPVTNVGNGYNTFFGTAMATCLQVETQLGPISTKANVYVCNSTEQVYNALAIDAAMDVDGGWGSFTDKLSFVQAMGTTSTSVIILVVATVISSTETAKNWSWLPSSAPGTALDLYRKYGDSWVSSVTKGGQYLASWVYQTTDEDSFISLTNEANLQFSGWGTDFTVDFNVRMQNVSSSTSVSYNFEQTFIGFTVSNTPKTMQDVMSLVETIGSLPVDNPQVFDCSTMSYTAVTGGPDFSQIDAYRALYIDPTGSKPGYSGYELRAKTNRAIIQAAADICSRYNCLGVDPRLTNIPTQLDTITSNIADWRMTVDKDPTKPGIDPPVIDTMQLIIPYLQYGQVLGNMSGDFGGFPWNDVSMANVLQGILPSQIVIHGGAYVDNISTTYEVMHGTFTQPPSHGGGGGDTYPPIQFGPGEYVTGTTLLSGRWINQITITTNFNPSGTSYPNSPKFGPATNVWKTPANACFIGFNGRSDVYVDALTPVAVGFKPCNWVAHPPRRMDD